MSLDKEQYEAQRWLETAREDLDAAKALLEKGKFSHACFFCQQSGEKALKAIWYFLGEDPWGHSIQKLIPLVSNVLAPPGHSIKFGCGKRLCLRPDRPTSEHDGFAPERFELPI